MQSFVTHGESIETRAVSSTVTTTTGVFSEKLDTDCVQVLPLLVHIMVVSTHSRFNTGRFICYAMLLFFGLGCLIIQVPAPFRKQSKNRYMRHH